MARGSRVLSEKKLGKDRNGKGSDYRKGYH